MHILQEIDNDTTTMLAPDYTNGFKNPDPVHPTLTLDEVDAYNKVVAASGD